MKSMTGLQFVNMIAARYSITQKKFGKIMHDPNASEAEKREALRKMEEAGGYENLPS